MLIKTQGSLELCLKTELDGRSVHSVSIIKKTVNLMHSREITTVLRTTQTTQIHSVGTTWNIWVLSLRVHKVNTRVCRVNEITCQIGVKFMKLTNPLIRQKIFHIL